jgi:glutamate synthase domain-containing protein 3
MLFGMNPDSDRLLEILGKTRDDFGRFRNVYMEDGYIVVHTRNGGGNRESYEDVFEEMSGHPWYSHDEDDDFDCTYANIYFKIPEGKHETFVALHGLNEGENPKKQWASLLGMMEALKK